MLLQKNVGLNLAFCVCKAECNYRIFNLLSTGVTLSPMLSILIEPRELWGTSDNMKIAESGEERDGRTGLHHYELAYWACGSPERR